MLSLYELRKTTGAACGLGVPLRFLCVISGALVLREVSLCP